MINPGIIIGWLILFVFIGVPIILAVIRFVTFRIAWKNQVALRSEPPKKYQAWRSFKTNKKYYINDDLELNSGVLVSSDSNNQGGSYYTLKEWFDLVDRERLIKV